MNSFGENPSSDKAFRKYFFLSAILIALLLLFIAFQAGVNGDDYFQNSYADKITGFYTSFGQDTSCVYHPEGPIQYYGGLFELLSGTINQGLDLTIHDPAYHHLRHVINALFGIGCMMFLAFWLRISGGWILATLGLWMIFFSPRFIGHAVMNPKDIPFAMGYIVTIYFFSRWLRSFPRTKWSDLTGIAVGLGVSLGIRIGGLILVGIITLPWTLKMAYILLSKERADLFNKTIPSTIQLVFFIIIGFGIGLFFWPYGLMDPIHHIPETLQQYNHFQVGINMLFSGMDVFGDEAPWYYHPVWILKTIPLSVFLGLILLSVSINSWKKYAGLQDIFLAVVVCLLPITYIIMKDTPRYDGWRHVLFIYPPLVYLATCGWYATFRKFWNQRIVRYLFLGVLSISMLEAGYFMIRNVTFPYVYFNPIGGGIHGAEGWYDRDYWGISAGNAVEWLKEEGIIKEHQQDQVTIATNFLYPVSVKVPQNPNINLVYTRYPDRHLKKWDYGIFVSRFIPGIQLREGTWPPPSQEVHAVTANGSKLAVILKNVDEQRFIAGEFLNTGRYPEAIQILEKKSIEHPQDETIWIDLGYAYQNMNDMANSDKMLKKALEINPHSQYAINYLAMNQLKIGDEEKSISLFNQSLSYGKSNYIAHFFLARIATSRGHLDNALNHGLQVIEINPGFRPGYALVAEIYQQLGDTANAQKYRAAAQNN